MYSEIVIIRAGVSGLEAQVHRNAGIVDASLAPDYMVFTNVANKSVFHQGESAQSYSSVQMIKELLEGYSDLTEMILDKDWYFTEGVCHLLAYETNLDINLMLSAAKTKFLGLYDPIIISSFVEDSHQPRVYDIGQYLRAVEEPMETIPYLNPAMFASLGLFMPALAECEVSEDMGESACIRVVKNLETVIFNIRDVSVILKKYRKDPFAVSDLTGFDKETMYQDSLARLSLRAIFEYAYRCQTGNLIHPTSYPFPSVADLMEELLTYPFDLETVEEFGITGNQIKKCLKMLSEDITSCLSDVAELEQLTYRPKIVLNPVALRVPPVE